MSDKIKTTALPTSNVNQRFVDVALFISFFAFFSLTLYNGVGGVESYGNSTKFQYIGTILGVPHSPGFPLYVILNFLWTYLPLPISVATKISLLSATFATAALVFFRRALFLLGTDTFPALVATIALGLSRIFWIRATESGTMAMSYFLVSAILFFFIKYSLKKDNKNLFISVILTFIAAFHAPICLWLLPLALLFLIFVRPSAWLKPIPWLAVSFGLIITAALCFFIFIRSHQHAPILEYVYPNTSFKRVFLTMLNAQFWPNYFFASPKIIFLQRLPQLVKESSGQLTIAVYFFSIAGVIYLLRKSITGALFFILIFFLSFLFKAHLYSSNLLGEFWLFFILTAFLCGLGLQLFHNYKKSIGSLLSLTFALLIFFNAFSLNKDILFRKSKNDYEALLLACTYNSNLLASDIYKWQEILRYYNFTNPYIKQRKIKLKDNVNFYNHSTNFFIEEAVKTQLDDARIPYFKIYSNETATLYIINNF